jgi:hypothetical protein
METINPADSALKANPSHEEFPSASEKSYEPTILITDKASKISEPSVHPS